MDWKRAIKAERAALKRIVALLLALADLAELACSRSQAVCSLVFWILRPAETVAWTLVALPSGALPAPIVRSTDAPADVKRLAMRLRELARELDREARLVFSVRHEDGDLDELVPFRTGRMLQIAKAIHTLAVPRPVTAPDTS